MRTEIVVTLGKKKKCSAYMLQTKHRVMRLNSNTGS